MQQNRLLVNTTWTSLELVRYLTILIVKSEQNLLTSANYSFRL